MGNQKRKVESPLFDDGLFCVNQKEISVDVKGVAQYYTSNGDSIHITPYNGVDDSAVEHFLNSWGLVSILHQRNMINFHASSIMLNGKGIMICGDSGAGKSSLTAAFSLNGAEFVSDDITVVILKKGKPVINKISNQIALKKEAISQLSLENKIPLKTIPFNNKKTYHFPEPNEKEIPLTHVIWLNTFDKAEAGLEFSEINGMDKFTMLRGEICGWEMLKGMPGTETLYLKQLIDISRNIRITKIVRPKTYHLSQLKKEVKAYLKTILIEESKIEKVC